MRELKGRGDMFADDMSVLSQSENWKEIIRSKYFFIIKSFSYKIFASYCWLWTSSIFSFTLKSAVSITKIIRVRPHGQNRPLAVYVG